MNQPVVTVSQHTPAIVTAAGNRAAYRFIEFFTAQIRNPNTRRAYVRSVGEFCLWIEDRGIPSIIDVSSVHVATHSSNSARPYRRRR
jgi:hypothetical protein